MGTAINSFGIFGVLFLIVTAVLWFFLPFAIFGIKKRLDEGNSHLKKISSDLAKLGIDSADIQPENEKPAPSEKTKQQSTSTTKAEIDAIERLESDGFTVTKYAVGTTSYYWNCQKGSLLFKARTVDELVLYADQ